MTATQLSLLDAPDRPMVRPSDPATSHQAANAVAPHLADQQARVLGAISVLRLATDEELADSLPSMNRGSVVRRRADLVDKGLVEPSGITKPTRSGCAAIIWQITLDGARVARRLAGAA